MYVTWLIHTCEMTHSYVCHTLIKDFPQQYKRSTPSFPCVTWHIHMRDMTHSHAWHDPFIRVPYTYKRPPPAIQEAYTLIPICNTTHSYVWHDFCTCVTWPIHVRISLFNNYGFLFQFLFFWHLFFYTVVCALFCFHKSLKPLKTPNLHTLRGSTNWFHNNRIWTTIFLSFVYRMDYLLVLMFLPKRVFYSGKRL